MESCILPCSFQSSGDDVIHWIKVAGELRVHSFYNRQNQFAHQNQHFRGRTTLFQDHISRGNASVLLAGVEVQDQGRYKCFISTIRGNKDTFINLKVDGMRTCPSFLYVQLMFVCNYFLTIASKLSFAAPVSKVNIDQVGNRMTCSSNWIYPEPELTWSTSPPSNMNLQNTTRVQQTEQQLYNISSSLILSDSDTDLIYSCTVSTSTSSRRATWRQICECRDCSLDSATNNNVSAAVIGF